MPTKQDIHDAIQKLEEVAVHAFVNSGFDPAAYDKVVRSQKAQRAQIAVDCLATYGHVFHDPRSLCMCCGFDRDEAKRQLSRNVTVGP